LLGCEVQDLLAARHGSETTPAQERWASPCPLRGPRPICSDPDLLRSTGHAPCPRLTMDEKALLERIVCDPTIFGGKPIVRGHRLAVEHVLGTLAMRTRPQVGMPEGTVVQLVGCGGVPWSKADLLTFAPALSCGRGARSVTVSKLWPRDSPRLSVASPVFASTWNGCSPPHHFPGISQRPGDVRETEPLPGPGQSLQSACRARS